MKTVSNLLLEEAIAVLQEGKNVSLYIRGNSMFPFLRDGKDILELCPPGDRALGRGDVVLFRYGGNVLSPFGESILLCRETVVGKIRKKPFGPIFLRSFLPFAIRMAEYGIVSLLPGAFILLFGFISGLSGVMCWPSCGVYD